MQSGQTSNKDWCPAACNHLNRICKKTGARIVISSSWRSEFTLEELKEIFSSNGIKPEYVIAVTPSYVEVPDEEAYCRGHEIREWMGKHAPENSTYAILDDLPVVLDSQKGKFIQLKPDKGFNDPDAVIRLIQILN